MDWVGAVVGVVVGVILGAAVVWALGRARSENLAQVRAELEAERAKRLEAEVAHAAAQERARQVEALTDEIGQRQRKSDDLQKDLAAALARQERLEAQLIEGEKRADEQRRLLETAETKFREAFASLSSEALRKNNSTFLELAKENLHSFSKEAQGDLEKRQQAIERLVEPLEKTLDDVRKHTHELEVKREGAYADIAQQIQSLTLSQQKLEKAASNMTIALRNPQARGAWGEMQLKTLAEQSGMVEGVHFVMQESTDTEKGRLRPDMIVNLPNRKKIVIDAKTPDAYLRAMQAEDGAERAQLIREHAAFVKSHLQDLSSKDYARQFDEAPDFVVMFLPGESFFSAALEADPTLIETGAAHNVILASPTTLLALLKAVAYGWRQENLAANAQRIATKGQQLYDRLCTAFDHVTRVGKGLGSAVGAYNEAVGSLERSVLPAAREMRTMGLDSKKELGEIPPITAAVREFQAPEARALPGLAGLDAPDDRETGGAQ